MNTSYISPADFVWEIELRSSDERALFVSTDKRPSTDSNSPFTDKPFSATTHHFEMPLVRCYTVPVMILDINFVITRPIYMIWYCINMLWFFVIEEPCWERSSTRYSLCQGLYFQFGIRITYAIFCTHKIRTTSFC